MQSVSPARNNSLAFADPPAPWRQFAAGLVIWRTGMLALLLLPPALLGARAVADTLLSVIAALFLVTRVALGDRGWLRAPHIWLSLALWAWYALCSCLAGNGHAIGEAIALGRFFLFVAALEFWLLEKSEARSHLQHVVLIAAVWVAVETWQQYLLGTNIFGVPRWGSGVLTGPFDHPRAGLTLQTIFFAAFLPPAMLLLRRPTLLPRLGGVTLLTAGVLTMAMIGQRMPMLLVIFGLIIAGLAVRRFRWAALLALLALVAAVAAARVVSPETYHTLVTVFVHRMSRFWAEPYAIIYQRAAIMAQAHPWIGLGFDGFRDHCNEPAYIHVVPWLPVTDIHESYACVIHPHNYWLQVATDAGLPAVVLFAALGIAWLRRMGQGLSDGGRPAQAAMFVSLCIMLWPVASTTALFTLPNAGWLFLLIGWGLAEARHGSSTIEAAS